MTGEKLNKMSVKKTRYMTYSLIFSCAIIIVFGWYLFETMENVRGRAPDFFLTDLENNAFYLSDFRGKVVLLEFMATWCGSCKFQMQDYKVVHEKYGEKLILISIDVDPAESRETLIDFVQEFPYATWIWALDTSNLLEAYKVIEIPKTVIVDQNGYIKFSHAGPTDSSVLIKEIDQLIK